MQGRGCYDYRESQTEALTQPRTPFEYSTTTTTEARSIAGPHPFYGTALFGCPR